ncbi:MAG: transglycosylase domain-containing protein [Gammaproteobacteria bacterium]|uniref:penicillin-binding protein 1A n=1 Tax=Rhodoferax sp. TaxID=50421 RepID=UPI0017A2D2DB|nr:transglycosylase domain-containing protein [Rhodoferax sp.]MBU3899367.1 transglycosylase domain-containing protein [Gammaproteobacteria bacterium]MBA3058389.1 glycosyl transferase [Rhodoferax sp.]MBU3997601.1 transglycosylase domain-containing protein [Gammaproteobacteria bacterium]MBU4080622.1 transglycosylase domain-containing protein [Gammaproteobacteria bacterium]MBU4113597.1 transglycosylase domain-containing protein [Gammaproteobacteria bacterium]
MNPTLRRAASFATAQYHRLLAAARPAATFATAQYHRLLAAARRHPWRAALLLPALLLLYVLLLIPFTPGIGDLRKAKTEAPSVLLASDGTVLAEYKRMNREWVSLDAIAPSVVDALIATEDRRFYAHHGIDFRRLVGAVLSTLGGDLQGGSTITQQLARNLYPEEIGRANSITRKIKEAITALKIEAVYSKDEILETYLNTVPFLYNAFGIEMAARTYFDKTADKLDVLQSATLIGMLKGTSYYNPVQNPERALKRRNLVLEQMAKNDKLDPARLAQLSKRPLKLNFERQVVSLGLAPHVAQHLRKWLVDWADQRDYDIQADGLRVFTSLDANLQKTANQAVTRQLTQLQKLADARRKRGQESAVLQAGFLALDPRSGAVRAWVGSRDFAQEQFDHVSQARRQPGSTFKPFVYGAAFMQGFDPSDTFMDEPVEIALPGSGVWTPSDNSAPSYQPTSLRNGLVYSKNTITAQLMQEVGPARVGRLAQALGVRQSKLDLVPSLALGTSPVTLLEMVAAYGSIANGGNYHQPFLLQRVEDRNGKLLEQFEPVSERAPAMPRAHALTLVNVMRGVIDEGTGAAIRYRYGIGADLAGKTGTTQDNTDGWFIMMNPQLVAGARVGFNDNSAVMGSWGQGARSALPMVGEVFQQAFRKRWLDAKAEFDIPRPRPAPPPEPEPRNNPLPDVVNNVLERFFQQLLGN